jgi:hypothetical protein
MRLHLAWRGLRSGVVFRLRLPDARLEDLVDLDPETRAVLGRCEQRAVLDPDYLEFLHCDKPFRAFVSAQGCHVRRSGTGNSPGAAQVEQVAARNDRASGLLTQPI